MEDEIIKVSRVRKYLSDKGYSGMILVRQDNFSWITSGGSSRVIISKEEGTAAVVITESNIYLIAQVMDGSHIMDEEMSGLNAEYIPLLWYEETILERAASLAGPRPISDVICKDAGYGLRDIYDLHFPLTEREISILDRLGRASDEILCRVSGEVKPGMTDTEVEAMLLYEYAKQNIQCDVLLIGTDERIFKYRHPAPVGRKLGRYILLHPAVRMNGLHCNVSRSIYFGSELPEEIEKAYDAVSLAEAYCMSRSHEGETWSSILDGHKELLKEAGFENHWKGHYPGGRTGYFVCQPDLSLEKDRRLCNNEAYDWFITVEGAKTEELTVNHNGELKIFSHTGIWPDKEIRFGNFSAKIPQIWMK